MTSELQTTIALTLVACAVGFFITRWWRKRKKPGCGGGCGCSGSAKKWKSELKSK